MIIFNSKELKLIQMITNSATANKEVMNVLHFNPQEVEDLNNKIKTLIEEDNAKTKES